MKLTGNCRKTIFPQSDDTRFLTASSWTLCGWFVLLIAVVVGSGVVPAYGTSVVMMADSDLADQATQIVDARVLERDATQVAGLIYTDYTMEVNRAIEGSVSTKITVRVLGGRADDRGLHVPGAPEFAPDDRVLLFLESQPNGIHRIMQFALGSFKEVTVDGQSLAVRDLSGVQRVSANGESLRGQSSDGTVQLRNFDRFVKWLQDYVAGNARTADYFVNIAKAKLSQVQAQFTLLGDAPHPRWFTFRDGEDVDWRMNQNGQPGLAGNPPGIDEFKNALQAWEDEPETPIAYPFAGTTSNTDTSQVSEDSGLIVFEDPNDEISGSFDCNQGGTLAIGGSFFSTSTRTWKGDDFNPNFSGFIITQNGIKCFFEDSPNASAAGAELFAHELGHTLGLGHSCGDDSSPSCSGNPTLDEALMRAFIHDDGRGAALRSDDQDGIQFLYSASPGAPSNLGASAVSSSQIDLSWTDNAVTEDGFKIFRDGSQIDTVGANTTSYSDTGLNADTEYCYTVKAFNSAGDSSASNQACDTTDVPGAPSNLSATAVSASQIDLSWNDNSDNEDEFKIFRDGSQLDTVGANTTGYSDTGLNADTEYCYTVKASNSVGNSSASNQACATTGQTPATFRVERTTGNVLFDGSMNSGGADLAERIRVSEPVEPGDVVAIDPQASERYRKTRRAHSELAAGVIASDPGVVLGADGDPPSEPMLGLTDPLWLAPTVTVSPTVNFTVPTLMPSSLITRERTQPVMALMGRVEAKATTANGPIRPGDLLTSASKPGYAMRCTDPDACEGAIIGKALEALDEETGRILMLVVR